MTAQKMTRESLIARCEHMIEEIDQLFLDAEHWNRIHPDEEPIDPDPDGELKTLRVTLRASLDALLAK